MIYILIITLIPWSVIGLGTILYYMNPLFDFFRDIKSVYKRWLFVLLLSICGGLFTFWFGIIGCIIGITRHAIISFALRISRYLEVKNIHPIDDILVPIKNWFLT